MRRSFALISAGITAFSIVLMVTVVYGLRAAAGPQVAPSTSALGAAVAQVSPHLEDNAEMLSPTVSPQAAAVVASEFLDRADATTVQLANYHAAEVYLVTFSSGDAVYISLSGQVLGSVPAPVQMASSNRNRKEREGPGGGGTGAGGDGAGEPEHEVEAGD